MGRLTLLNDEVRDAHRAQSSASLICHDDLMTRHSISQSNSRGHSRNDSLEHAAMVGPADIQSDGVFAERTCVDDSGPRAQCLTERQRGTSVQKAERLCVALHGHRRNHALSRLFKNHNAEFVVEGSELNRPWRIRHDVILPTVHQAKESTS